MKNSSIKLKDKINFREPLIFGGAMGTYYKEKFSNPLPQCEMANIFDSESIYNIHLEYLKAGAKAIKTNTFGANKKTLNCSNEILEKVLEEGFLIAQRAVDNFEDKRYVFADIGPIPHEGIQLNERELFEEYKIIVNKFIEMGVEYFLFETFDRLDPLLEVFKYIKSKNNDSFIIISFAVNPDGYTRTGRVAKELIKEAAESDFVDSIGFNCVSGPNHILKLYQSIDIPQNKIFSVMPNASYPTILNNRVFYSTNANYFSNVIVDFLRLGVKIVGGCCGTTPEHTKEISRKIRDLDIKTNDVTVEKKYVAK